MSRLAKKPGDILTIPLARGRRGYAQWLPDGSARVFRLATKAELPIAEVTAAPTAFRVLVARPSPGQYGWSKIGKAPIPPNCAEPQRYAKKDIISGKLSIYYNGVESPATAMKVKGLETLAVWGHPHIVERLEAILAGRRSKFAEQINAQA